MLKITIIAVGKLKERYWRDAMDEYLKRLRSYANVSIVEIADASDNAGAESARQQEGEAILKALPADALCILLDINGAQRSSEQLATWFDRSMIDGVSHIACIIGGSNGVSAEVCATCKQSLSFGSITLPHNLARIVLVEQIYRAFKILRNEPYHK